MKKIVLLVYAGVLASAFNVSAPDKVRGGYEANFVISCIEGSKIDKIKAYKYCSCMWHKSTSGKSTKTLEDNVSTDAKFNEFMKVVSLHIDTCSAYAQ
jgi:hypothetical protein